MPTAKACYRKLGHYKYQLVKDYAVAIPITPSKLITTKFIKLTKAGKLTIKARYAWDGASGPARDTKTIMRASLVHDALYQLMRGRDLDHTVHRKPADKLLRNMCLADGMAPVRAKVIFRGVRLGGARAARPPKKIKDKIVCVP